MSLGFNSPLGLGLGNCLPLSLFIKQDAYVQTCDFFCLKLNALNK